MGKKKLILDVHGQMSDSFAAGAFLLLSGGFQDAYTYCCRGEVFANAQTGNIVLMSGFFLHGQWAEGLRYLIPLLSFVLGVYVAEHIRRRFRRLQTLHWRQLVLAGEIFLLFAVGFLPSAWSSFANALVSFVCAMQVETFRKLDGNAYASTMCIGNLRSGTAALCAYRHTSDRSCLHKAGQYYAMIAIFAVGAGIGSLLTGLWQEKAIWLSCLFLAVSFALMFVKADEREPRAERRETK